jgi:hypothetical protein
MGAAEILMMSGGPMLAMFLPGLAVPFLYIYLLHDYTGRRTGTRDPLLGAKIATTLMMTIGGQLALAGLAMVAISVVGDGDTSGTMKSGFGMLLAGGIVAALPTVLYLTRIRTEGGARVGHQALGLNAILTAAVFTGAVIVACQAVFHDFAVAEALAVALVYGPAMVVSFLRLLASPIPPAVVSRTVD